MWETPRDIAIVAAVIAVIVAVLAGMLGYMIGATPSAPIVIQLQNQLQK